jgi:hypothetical protein
MRQRILYHKDKDTMKFGTVFHFGDDNITGNSVFTSTKSTSFDVDFLADCDSAFLNMNASFNGLCCMLHQGLRPRRGLATPPKAKAAGLRPTKNCLDRVTKDSRNGLSSHHQIRV